MTLDLESAWECDILSSRFLVLGGYIMTKSEFLEKLRQALGNDLTGAIIQENVNYYSSYLPWKLNDLTDGRNAPHPVYICHSRFFHLKILLSCQEYLLLSFHDLLDCLDRLGSADIKVADHLR